MTEPSLGKSIGLQDTYKDYTSDILDTIDLIGKKEQEKSKIDKENRNSIYATMDDIYVESSKLWGDYPDKVREKALVFVNSTIDKLNKNKNYNPKADKEVYSQLSDIRNDIGTYTLSTKRIMEDVNKASDTKLYVLNDELYNAINSGKSDELKKVNNSAREKQGLPKQDFYGDVYTTGLLSSRIKPDDFIKDLQASAGNLVKNKLTSSSIKGIDVRITRPSDETIDVGWETFRRGNNNYITFKQANQGEGISGEDIDNLYKDLYRRSISQQIENLPKRDEGNGSETGDRNDKFVISNKEVVQKPFINKIPYTQFEFSKLSESGNLTGGDVKNESFEKIVVKNKGGGLYKIDSFRNENEDIVTGRFDGELLKRKGSNELFATVLVPDPAKLQMPEEIRFGEEAARNMWIETEYQRDPNKFKIEYVDVNNTNNKTAVNSAIGGDAFSLFNGNDEGSNLTEKQAKVVAAFKKKYQRDPSNTELDKIKSDPRWK